jgi:hypothetical protein
VDLRTTRSNRSGASLTATSRVGTARRNVGKERQEGLVQDALIRAGMTLVPNRKVETMNQAPRPGEFCGESLLGTWEADLMIGLYDYKLRSIRDSNYDIFRFSVGSSKAYGLRIRRFLRFL